MKQLDMLADLPSITEQRKQQPHMPTRTPDPQASADWAERAREWQADNGHIVAAYFDELDGQARYADAHCMSRITPRGCWESVRRGFRVQMPNAFQAEFSRQWRAANPQWAHMIRGAK